MWCPTCTILDRCDIKFTVAFGNVTKIYPIYNIDMILNHETTQEHPLNDNQFLFGNTIDCLNKYYCLKLNGITVTKILQCNSIDLINDDIIFEQCIEWCHFQINNKKSDLKTI